MRMAKAMRLANGIIRTSRDSFAVIFDLAHPVGESHRQGSGDQTDAVVQGVSEKSELM
jgi:hypothetical protein